MAYSTDRLFDVVVCVGPCDTHLSKLAIASLAFFARPRRTLIICARELFEAFRNWQPHGMEVVCIDEDTLIKGVTLAVVRECLARRGAALSRAGWYLQQFLKMGICRQQDLTPHYLIWDADTVLLREVAFQNERGQVLVHPATEHHRPYFETLQRLLGMGRLVDYSFVAEHLLVRAVHMRRLLHRIETRFPRQPTWVHAVLEAIDDPWLSFSGFSEFETYGNFVQSVDGDEFQLRKLVTLRSGAALFGRNPRPADIRWLARRYDVATFERWNVASPMRQTLRRLSRVMRPRR